MDAEGVDLVVAPWSALHMTLESTIRPKLERCEGAHLPDEEMLIHWLVT